jgi:hypothetical protein
VSSFRIRATAAGERLYERMRENRMHAIKAVLVATRGV